MKMNVVKKVGINEYVFQVEGENLHSVIMESKNLSFQNIKECGLCQSELLYLTAYVTKEEKFEYTKVCCAKCGASITFGQVKKSPNTFYLRKNDDGTMKWEADDRTEKKAPVRKPNLPEGFGLKEVDVNDDAPF